MVAFFGLKRFQVWNFARPNRPAVQDFAIFFGHTKKWDGGKGSLKRWVHKVSPQQAKSLKNLYCNSTNMKLYMVLATVVYNRVIGLMKY
jgi:hypothetical protein